jgi:hypothetical protein
VSQIDTSTNLVPDTSSLNTRASPLPPPLTAPNISAPSSSSISVTTHSPMSSGVGDSVKTSTRSVSIESGTRNRSSYRDTSPNVQRYGQNDTSISSSYSLLNQSANTQVTDNLRVQHQREKQELSELNDRFRGKEKNKKIFFFLKSSFFKVISIVLKFLKIKMRN